MNRRLIVKGFIPSAFTLGNLLCGFLSINNVVEGRFISAAWWIIIAGIFDSLDGKIARITGSSSDFGVEFDSIADVTSFGLAPAVLIYNYMFADAGFMGFALPFMFLAAGAIRLARFNLSATTGSKGAFTGMPIPSGAGILASYVLFAENVWSGLGGFDVTVALVVVSSIAMVSTFRYATFPRLSFSTRGDTVKTGLFFSLIVGVILFPDEIFFPVGITYLLSGPVMGFVVPVVSSVINRDHGH